MKKKILYFLLLNVELLFAQETFSFQVIRDVAVSDGNVGTTLMQVNADSIVDVVLSKTYVCETNEKLCLYGKCDDNWYEFCDEDLKLQGCDFQIPFQLRNSKWIMNYYYEMLEKKDLKYLTNNESNWHPEKLYIEYEDSKDYWYARFNPLYLIFGKYCIKGSQSFFSVDLSLILQPGSLENNIFEATITTFDYEDKNRWHPQWRKMSSVGAPLKLLFELDGDFLYVYKNTADKNNFLYTLAKADDDTLKQIYSFVRTGNFNESKIKYPKHGTKRYEDSLVSNVDVMSDKELSTNVTGSILQYSFTEYLLFSKFFM